MRVSDVMTRSVVSCKRDSELYEVAKMMRDHDCGAIPVTDDEGTPVGIVTDRDIVVRMLADGKDPTTAMAGDCMTDSCLTVRVADDLDTVYRVMEDNKVRRVVVEDQEGHCCGIIAQADIAQHGPLRKAGEVVAKVSSPDGSSGRMQRINGGGLNRGMVVASAIMASSLVGAGAWLARRRGSHGRMGSHL